MRTQKATIKRTGRALRATLGNGAVISFALEGARLLGIRDVRVDGVDLRKPGKLWRPMIYTPEGLTYLELRFKKAVALKDGGVRVETEAVGLRGLRREEDDEYLCDVLDVDASDAPAIDRLCWELRPSELDLDGSPFKGFSYVYRFESSDPSRKIHRLFDCATWEIGGSVKGNTLLCQGQVNPPVTRLARDAFFTTACNYYLAEMGAVMGPAQRVSMQRLSRVGTLQSFDFLTHASGILFGRFDPLVDIMSLLQKNKGEDVLHVIDECRQPLTHRFATNPKHILFLKTATALPREDQRNLWCRALDFVHDAARRRHGITRSTVIPRVWTPQVDKEAYDFGGDKGPRERALYYLADHVLPRWAEMGVKEICTPSYWVSDYTVDRLKFKDQTGMHGAFTVSGICCVREHEIDPLWGGPDALAYFVKKAHALRIQVQLWWATHLSRRAPIFARRPDFMVKSRDGQPGCAGIGHHTIIPMNLNNPECFAWELGKLKRLYEATGVDGFFHDSYGNYTFLPINYNDETRQSQQEAYTRLLRELQKIGMRSITVEGLGPFGTGHFGMGLLPSTKGKAVRYQNALDWWLEDADMVYGLNMGIHSRVWPDREAAAQAFAFRCIAAGGRFGFSESVHHLEVWKGWLKDQNLLHSRIAPLQGRRTLLPADRGVVWDHDDATQTLFAFTAFAFALPRGRQAVRITARGEECVAAPGGALSAEAMSVYRIG